MTGQELWNFQSTEGEVSDLMASFRIVPCDKHDKQIQNISNKFRTSLIVQ